MIDIEKLALLARIKLSTNEKENFQKEFEEILDYVSRLKDVDEKELGIENYEPEIKNVMREDKNYHQPRDFSEDLLKEVPVAEGDYVRVKHILE